MPCNYPAEYNRFSAALLEDEHPVSIRLNPLKWDNSSFFILHSSLKEVPWATGACYLDQRLTFTFDPLFHAGGYYVQEASSSISVRLRAASPPTCAACCLRAACWWPTR